MIVTEKHPPVVAVTGDMIKCVRVRDPQRPRYSPAPLPPTPTEYHSQDLTPDAIEQGIYLIENLQREGLSSARPYEFAFVVQPLKIQGAAGSAVAPITFR